MRHRIIAATAAVAAGTTLLFPAVAHADLGDRVTAALHAGSFLAYVLVFLGGILTSLTPCVYPLIPITLSIFGARGDSVSRPRAVALAAAYVGGIGAMYSALGVGSALAGRAFGTFMSSPWVMVPIAGVFLVMAVSMFGAFELNLPPELAAKLSQLGGAGFSGAFVMGLVGGIIAAPCTGPVLASVLTYVATTRSVFFGGSLLFTYALGMGVLFFVLAATAAGLPKSGAWMEAVKSIFGVVMIVAALYFLRNVSAPLRRYGDFHTSWKMIQLGVAAAGVAIGGIHLSFHDSIAKRVRKAVGVGAIVFGGFGFIAGSLTAPELEWVTGEPAAIARAATEKRPVLLDFSAAWCIPCRELDVQVFADDKVREELSRFITGRVDCTDDDDATSAVKAKYGADTLPTVVLLGSDGKVGHKFNRVMTTAELLDSLKRVE